MFVVEIQKVINEENDNDEEGKFSELLNKAMYIINRIKSKCNTPYGAGQSAGPSVHGNQPLTPRHGGPMEKSWHFDVSKPE